MELYIGFVYFIVFFYINFSISYKDFVLDLLELYTRIVLEFMFSNRCRVCSSIETHIAYIQVKFIKTHYTVSVINLFVCVTNIRKLEEKKYTRIFILFHCIMRERKGEGGISIIHFFRCHSITLGIIKFCF